jgi:methionyl-tRNA formyltransferase
MKKNKHDASIAFFGTPQFAVDVLDALNSAGSEPDIIITAPDKPAGRGLVLQAPPVKEWAAEHAVPVLQPEHLTPPYDGIDILMNSEWDLFIVAAYGKILPKAIIDLPRRGVLNVHPSLLPRFRGASPIETQILMDEKETGVSIMRIDEHMDHGPIVAQAAITPEEWPLRASMLEALLAKEGGTLLAEALPLWLNGEIEAVAQNHELATFTKKIKKEDGEVDITADGYQNYLKFCAYDAWPGTFFFKDGKRVKITDAEYTNGTFRIRKVVPEGKKEIDFDTFSAR